MIDNDPASPCLSRSERRLPIKGRSRFPKEKKRANESELKGSLEER